MQTCTQRSSPAGQCVIQQNDLLSGQQAVGRVFAVPAASTDCFPYSYELMRACRSDRTFAPDTTYDSCDTRPVSRDVDGCAKLPGYTFYRGWLLPDASNWRIGDGTHWERVEGGPGALALAAQDMPLMAARCSALPACAAFVNTANSTDLLYQLPLPSAWVRAPDTADYCTGIYAKAPPPASCPRVAGYLFIPTMTLDVAAANRSDSSGGAGFTPAGGPTAGPCADCADATALAVRCDAYVAGSAGSSAGRGGCVGFSNYHGLILASSGPGSADGGLLADAPLAPFTSSPCAGLFMRAGRVFPAEVEELDKLLCGEWVYCTSQLRYHAAGTSSAAAGAAATYYVDISVDVLSDLLLPRGLLDAGGGGLRPLPAVRSLVVRCGGGAALMGGLPVGLVALMPALQELRVVGCGLAGQLPGELAQLRYLRVLDLSANRLGGGLPDAWANMSLGYLNLSSNLLTGTLPPSWQGVLAPAAAAAAPAAPPPFAPRQVTAAASPPPPPPPRSSLLVADLSANGLSGAVPRDYVEAACVHHRLRMQLQGEPSAQLVAALGAGGARPTFLLHYNPGVAAWAGRYEFAVTGLGGELHGGGNNLCGADRYKIALGVVWGVFGACLLVIIAVSAAAAWRVHRRRSRGRGFMTEADLALSSRASAASADSDADSSDGGSAAAAICGAAALCGGGGSGRLAALLERLWARRWVRQLTLLARLGYLAADVALDVSVTVWLFADGDASASAVCLAFIVATQAAVSAALWGSLAGHLFESRLLVAGLYPALLAAGPLVGPVLAVANIRNPDVPVVFWRYLELVEFCVALLQAPAEAVTQSAVYARQNLMGGGMYIDHALFLASILLSLGDMLIAAWKLCRYKRGPLRRVLVALTHLDKVRDPVDYRKRLRDPRDRSSGGGGGGGHGADGGAGMLHYLETPLNPAGGGLGRSSRAGSASSGGNGSREGSHERLPPLGPLLPPQPPARPSAGGAGAEASAGAHHPLASSSTGTIGLELHPADHGAAPPSPGAETVDGGASTSSFSTAAAGSPGAPAAHTFTHLTPPRYRPSLLAASASRLGGGGSPGAAPGHSPPVLSRLGRPPGSGSGSGRGSVTIPAHPPLRPLRPSLPVTPSHPPSRDGAGFAEDGDEGRASSTAHSGRSGGLAAAAAAAIAAAAADAEAEAEARRERSQDAAAARPSGFQHGDGGGGGGGGGSLSRRSRSVQEGYPPPAVDAVASSLVGSLSSDIVGLAATGGHGPPHPQPGPQGSQPPSRRPSGGGGALASSGPHPTAPPLPPLSIPPGPLHSDDDRYLASAAAAAAAALAEPRRRSSVAGAGPSPGAPAPAGLQFSSPRGRSHAEAAAGHRSFTAASSPRGQGAGARSPGPAGSSSLRQVASIREGAAAAAAAAAAREPHSAGASPARRRGEALSIAVPPSPVHESGIEVIRMSRNSSARHASPSSSRGDATPTASVRLPPPPQPPPWLAPGAPPMPPRPPRRPEG